MHDASVLQGFAFEKLSFVLLILTLASIDITNGTPFMKYFKGTLSSYNIKCRINIIAEQMIFSKFMNNFRFVLYELSY